MKIALYARVSTDDKGQNPETQLLALREQCQRRGDEIVEEYIEVGWSGGKERRPQLDRLMADAKKKKFDAVMVWKFDRFARSTAHMVKAQMTFKELNVDFISLTEQIDTTTPIGKFMFVLIAAMAEMERDIIRQRVVAGMKRARQEGRKVGRPRALVDEQKVAERVQAGEPIAKIARETGINRVTVRSIWERVGKGLLEAVERPLNASSVSVDLSSAEAVPTGLSETIS